MTTPAPDIEAELRSALGANSGNLGRVYLLLQEGRASNTELIDAGAVANAGAASNSKTMINAILTGDCPSSPSLTAQTGRAIGGLLRTNPGFSEDAQRYLTALRATLDEHSQDSEAVEREDRQLDVASEVLERTIENLNGVYVYTFPTYFRTVQKTDPERFLYKVGKTDRYSSVRIREQQRATTCQRTPGRCGYTARRRSHLMSSRLASTQFSTPPGTGAPQARGQVGSGSTRTSSSSTVSRRC